MINNHQKEEMQKLLNNGEFSTFSIYLGCICVELGAAEIARQSGVSRAHIYKLARGESDDPKLQTICKLLNVLGYSIQLIRNGR